MKLHIGQGLNLPDTAAGETFLIVGKRGSGKSSTATRFAEQLVHAKVPVAVLDPVDVWWGLKSGLEVYVFGGDHSDLPLEASAGALMADVVVDHRVNVVMVLRAFSNREKARFVSDFAEQLYKRNRDTMHLFCEEAHEVMPQNPYAGEEEMLGRMLRLEKQGRTSGIGMTAITQRPASLNKNATTQAEILVAHRTLGPQDVKAIDGWIQYHHQQEQRQDVLATLGELKTGEAWIWAPDFPEDEPIGLRRVRVLAPETFDSRRTPKPGERCGTPKDFAPVDLDRLREKMAKTIERAKAADPKALRTEIASLKRANEVYARQIAAGAAAAPKMVQAKRIEVAVLKNGALKNLRYISDQWLRASEAMLRAEQAATERASTFRATAGDLAVAIKPVLTELNRITSAPSALSSGKTESRGTSEVLSDGSAVRAAAPRPASPSTTRRGMTPAVRSGEPRVTEGVSGPQQRMLDALAWLESIGTTEAKWTVLAFLSGQSPKSSGYEKNVSTLRSAALIHGPRDRLGLTVDGSAAANVPDAPASSEELHRAIYAKISTPQERILRALIAAYPRNLTWDELAAKGEQSPTSSGFEKNVSTLKSYGLIDGSRGTGYVALQHLFLEEGVMA